MAQTVSKNRLLVRRDTTANWNARRDFVPLDGELIIYTDHRSIIDSNGNTVYVPGIKMGDGNAYLIDIPFIETDTDVSALTQELRTHEADTTAHITAEERQFWDNKLNCEIENETLILNRN